MNSRGLSLAVMLLVGVFAAGVHAMTPGTVSVELKLDDEGCVSETPKILLEAPAWVVPDNLGNYSTKAGVIWLISQVDKNGKPAPNIKRKQDLVVTYQANKAASPTACLPLTMKHFNAITISPNSAWDLSYEVTSRDKTYWSTHDISCFGYVLTAPAKSGTDANGDDYSCHEKKKDPVIIIKDGGGARMNIKLKWLLWLLAASLGVGGVGYALYFKAKRRLRELQSDGS